MLPLLTNEYILTSRAIRKLHFSGLSREFQPVNLSFMPREIEINCRNGERHAEILSTVRFA